MTEIEQVEQIRPGDIIVDRSLGIKVRYVQSCLSLAQVKRIQSGAYEKKEVQAIRSCLRGGERVLELGGGIGYVSTVVCKTKAPATYDLVEANPNLIPIIKDTHELNEVAVDKIHQCIVTSDLEALRRGYYDFNIGASFGASSVNRIPNTTGSVRVPTSDIRLLMAERKPEVLIADIEGAEVGLLSDVDISSVELAIIEVHPTIVGGKGIRLLFDDMSRHCLTYSSKGSHGAVVVFHRVTAARKRTIQTGSLARLKAFISR